MFMHSRKLPFDSKTLTSKTLTVKLTSKGQLTIPQEFRVKYGLIDHAEVEFVAHPQGVLIKKAAAQTRGKRVLGSLKSGGKVKGSTAQWLKLTRGE